MLIEGNLLFENQIILPEGTLFDIIQKKGNEKLKATFNTHENGNGGLIGGESYYWSSSEYKGVPSSPAVCFVSFIDGMRFSSFLRFRNSRRVCLLMLSFNDSWFRPAARTDSIL